MKILPRTYKPIGVDTIFASSLGLRRRRSADDDKHYLVIIDENDESFMCDLHYKGIEFVTKLTLSKEGVIQGIKEGNWIILKEIPKNRISLFDKIFDTIVKIIHKTSNYFIK